MFQVPVENLDHIRSMRPWVKSVLLNIGLASCKDLLNDLKGFGPSDRYFYNTSWPDIASRELVRKKVRYRTKPYCCSLCSYSANVLASLRNHLNHCHEDEVDQELQIQCPDCSFASRPDVVSRHFWLFHEPAVNGHSPKENVVGNGKSSKGYIKHFTCLKCNFSNTSFCSMKKHVLITHFHSLLSAYVGLQTKEDLQQPPAAALSGANTLPPERFYCKKCSATVSSQEELMSHILTADVHKNLENKLRSVISEHNKRSGFLKQVAFAPKPQAGLSRPPDTSAPHTADSAKPPWSHLALSQNIPSLAMAQPLTLVQPVTSANIQPWMGAPGSSWSLTHSLSDTTQSHATFVSSPLPVSQTSLSLQPSAPSTVIFSGRASPNRPVDPPALPVSQPLGPVNKSVGMSNLLPVSQAIQPGILSLTQPMGSTSLPVGPLVRSVGLSSRPVEPTSRLTRPRAPSSGLSVSNGVLQTISPGTISVSQVVSLAVLPKGQMTPASVIPAQTAASGVLPTGQAVQSRDCHVGHTVSSQVFPSCQTVSFRVLPVDHLASSGLLSPKQLVVSDVPVNQVVSSHIPLLGQTVTSGVLSADPPVRPSMLQLSQSVGPSILPVSQSVRAETSQNTIFLKSGSGFRKLLPTRTQVNGKPIYMLDPIPVTLPIPQGASLMTVTPSQVPNKFLPPSGGTQTSCALPSLSSSRGLEGTADQNIFVQVSSPEVRQANQWKICPVCKVFFPSNVYQAHMEVAHKQSEFISSEKFEPLKLAVCAPFLKWTREKAMRCLSCRCLVSEEELMYHLLTHGLGCLFCPCTFHNIQDFLEHSRIKHVGRKKLSLDYSNRGSQLSLDANGNLLFPHLDFIISLPKEKIGEQEICLAILSGIYATSLVPLYVKVRPQVKAVPKLSEQELTCPLCLSTFMIADAYMLHLKDRHHIMPVAYTVLSSPSFRCVHCCLVYPGNLTMAAISLHLLYCEYATKGNSSAQQVQSSFVESSEQQFVNGKKIPDSTCPVKRKWPDGHLGTEDHRRDGKDSLHVLKGNAASGPEEGTCPVPLKRQRNENTTQGLVVNDDLLQILALDPQKYKDYHEKKKQFLKDYFHKKPYPTRKEVELLSLFLKMEKINVALFFGTRRYICLKAIEVHRPSVLLGFDMSELKNVKHRLNFEPQYSV